MFCLWTSGLGSIARQTDVCRRSQAIGADPATWHGSSSAPIPRDPALLTESDIKSAPDPVIRGACFVEPKQFLLRKFNHLSVHQWIRSAIRDSQQPISPIRFLFLKLPPPPCAVLLVIGFNPWTKDVYKSKFGLKILRARIFRAATRFWNSSRGGVHFLRHGGMQL